MAFPQKKHKLQAVYALLREFTARLVSPVRFLAHVVSVGFGASRSGFGWVDVEGDIHELTGLRVTLATKTTVMDGWVDGLCGFRDAAGKKFGEAWSLSGPRAAPRPALGRGGARKGMGWANRGPSPASLLPFLGQILRQSTSKSATVRYWILPQPPFPAPQTAPAVPKVGFRRCCAWAV